MFAEKTADMSSSSFQQVASHRGQGSFGPEVENVPIPNDNDGVDDVNLISEGHENVSDYVATDRERVVDSVHNDEATDRERVVNSVHSETDPMGEEVQLHTAAVRTTSGRTNVVLPITPNSDARLLPNVDLVPFPARHGSGAQLRSTAAPRALNLTSPPTATTRGRSPPESQLRTRPPSPVSPPNSAEGLVTMGHISNIAARLTALESAFVESPETNRENTRDKRAMQSELRVLSTTVDDINERVTAIQEKHDEHQIW